VERYPDIADHIAVVRDRRRGMPAWEDALTPEEIEAVVRYEREGL
jgi:mono/diheme cytochrome c family protein